VADITANYFQAGNGSFLTECAEILLVELIKKNTLSGVFSGIDKN
jgi:hypothetical protein